MGDTRGNERRNRGKGEHDMERIACCESQERSIKGNAITNPIPKQSNNKTYTNTPTT